jgi:hypothetical protein
MRRKKYYNGSIYNGVLDALGWLGPRLYRGIKPLYLMFGRAVDVDAGIVPGGWLFPADSPTAWPEARDLIFSWSRWNTRGVLYLHYGATYGVSGLKVVDARDARRILVQPLDPMRFMLIRDPASYDDTPLAAVIVEKWAGGHEYAEVITAEEIRTFVDGEPAGVGGREAQYRNELGAIPVFEVRHLETGEILGEATYQKAIPLLDEVNQLASYLADIIAKHAEPQWAMMGSEPTELVKSGDNVWFIPAGGDAKPLVADIDIDGVLAFVQEIRDQCRQALPELAFDELKGKDRIATATLELQLMELVLKIKRVRPNYDDGLARALRLAGAAGAQMGLPEIALLNDPQLAFDEDRSVLPLDRATMIELEMQELALEQMRGSFGGEGLNA